MLARYLELFPALPAFQAETCDLCSRSAALEHTLFDGIFFRCPRCQVPAQQKAKRRRSGATPAAGIPSFPALTPQALKARSVTEQRLERLAVLVTGCAWDRPESQCSPEQLQARSEWTRLMETHRQACDKQLAEAATTFPA